MAYDGPERRYIYRHHPTCISIVYKCPRLGGLLGTRISRACEVADMNWRGGRFYTKHKIRRGCVIEILFDCPVDFSLSLDTPPVKARVTWRKWSKRRNVWRTGANFLDTDGTFKDAILQMIDSAVAHEEKFRNRSADTL